MNCAINIVVAGEYPKDSRPDDGFKARTRKSETPTTNNSAVKLVADAINLVLEQAENERTG